MSSLLLVFIAFTAFSGGATVIGFNVSVKIGEVRTDKVVRSVGQAWVENGS